MVWGQGADRQRQVSDPVAVVAELLLLRGGRLRRRIELWRVGEEGIAPLEQGLGGVAVGDDVNVAGFEGDCLKGEAAGGGGGFWRGDGRGDRGRLGGGGRGG